MSTVVLNSIAVNQARTDLEDLREEFDSQVGLDDGDDATEAFSRLNAVIDAMSERFPQIKNFGQKTTLRDLNGKRLRIGDSVKVYKSNRYGDPTGILMGQADGVGSQGQRVRVALDSGQDDNYTPSVGRVERLVKASA